MTEPSTPTPAPPAEHAPSPPAAATTARLLRRGPAIVVAGVLLLALAAAALVLAWNTQQQLRSLEAELVKRQQGSDGQATEARMLARQAELSAREAGAKLALLEARVAETGMQRSQIEDLIGSLARSRDENVLADLEAAIRVALQQTAITGSPEPLVLTLKQAEERLARINQPRLEQVRRALAQDLERTRAARVTDLTLLTIRIDEVIRLVDDLPLLSTPERRPAPRPVPAARPAASAASAGAPAPSAIQAWVDQFGQRWGSFGSYLWAEIKALVRVTRIDQPEAMLVAPEQAFFLRENLKLKLLNARLAVLSRQFETAQSDLRDANAAIEKYFDRNVRRVAVASDTLRQVMAQARLVTVPRPDATLAVIATLSAGR